MLAAALICASLAACTRDPEKLKRRFAESGDRYLAEQKYGEASIEYLKALQQDPQFAEARLKLAETYNAAGNTKLAFPEYVKAADLLTENEWVQVKAGQLLVNGGFFEEAKERARKVLVRNPKNADALMVLGNALAGLKSIDDAVGVIGQAVQVDPERAGVYANLGVFQIAQGDAASAEATFLKALEASPNSTQTIANVGEFYRAVKRYPEAEAMFKRGLAVDADDARINRALGSLYVEWSRPEEAEPYFKRVVERSKDLTDQYSLSDFYVLIGRVPEAIRILDELAKAPGQYAKARTKVAVLSFAAGRTAESEATIDEILQKEPLAGEALVTKARLLLVQQRLPEARAAIRSALSLVPASAQAHLTAGRIELANRDVENARKEFNEVLRLSPNSLPALLELSEFHRNQQQIDTAIQFAEQAIRANPKSLPARLTLLRGLLVRPDDRPRADAELQAILNAFPNSARAHGVLGTLALERNNVTAASLAFRRELGLNPGSVEALAGLIAIDLSRNDINSARTKVEQALAQNPDSSEFYVLSAKVYRATNEPGRMQEALTKAIELDPSNPEPYGMLGHLFLSSGRTAEAKQQYEQTAKLRPNLVGPPTMLGLLNYAEGNRVAAKQWWEKALAIDPEAVAAANNLAWLVAETGGDLETALQLGRRALQKLPDQPEFNDTVGWIYHLRKSPREAIWYLSQAIEKEPKNALYQFHLGMAYAQKGEDASARRHLQQVLALDRNFPQAETVKKTIATLIY